MRRVKRFLLLLTLLAIFFVSYELLLTVQHASTINVQSLQRGRVNSLDQHTYITSKRMLRQLLQDREITQLPVKIVTDCQDNRSPDNRTIKTLQIIFTKNQYLQDPNIVCLNESHLYRESFAQYGVPFDQLSVLQQKASIVRAVLSDLEQRNQLEIKAKLNKFVTEEVFKPDQEAAQYLTEGSELNQDSEIKIKRFNGETATSEVSPRLNNLPRNANSAAREIYLPHHVLPSRVTGSLTISTPTPKNKKKKKPPQMNEDLKKFKGARVKQSYNLADRGFSSDWRVNSTVVNHRLKFITMTINSTDPSERSVTRTSLNPDLLQRAKFQHDQVDLFCRQHTHPPSTLPLEDAELDNLFQHLLYDDTRKMVFCYVPKNGCSNMKRLMLVLNGILPPEASKENRPAETVLKEVHSFRNLTHSEALYRLTHYLKFAIVRNPLERLLSAYKNKLERPFIANLRKLFPERLKAFILKRYRRQDFEKWISINNSTDDIHPSFDEFVQFMNTFPLTMYNEHFKPFLDLCNPCAVKFDVYLSFKTLEYDIYALMEYLNIPFGLYPESIAHKTEPTSSLLEDYFSQVSPGNKAQLYRRLSREFEFYYSLHPEEWGMNYHL